MSAWAFKTAGAALLPMAPSARNAARRQDKPNLDIIFIFFSFDFDLRLKLQGRGGHTIALITRRQRLNGVPFCGLLIQLARDN
jgi:hypothetical protein